MGKLEKNSIRFQSKIFTRSLDHNQTSEDIRTTEEAVLISKEVARIDRDGSVRRLLTEKGGLADTKWGREAYERIGLITEHVDAKEGIIYTHAFPVELENNQVIYTRYALVPTQGKLVALEVYSHTPHWESGIIPAQKVENISLDIIQLAMQGQDATYFKALHTDTLVVRPVHPEERIVHGLMPSLPDGSDIEVAMQTLKRSMQREKNELLDTQNHTISWHIPQSADMQQTLDALRGKSSESFTLPTYVKQKNDTTRDGDYLPAELTCTPIGVYTSHADESATSYPVMVHRVTYADSSDGEAIYLITAGSSNKLQTYADGTSDISPQLAVRIDSACQCEFNPSKQCGCKKELTASIEETQKNGHHLMIAWDHSATAKNRGVLSLVEQDIHYHPDRHPNLSSDHKKAVMIRCLIVKDLRDYTLETALLAQLIDLFKREMGITDVALWSQNGRKKRALEENVKQFGDTDIAISTVDHAHQGAAASQRIRRGGY
jgi:Tfp pilus assembly protein PilX